MGTITKALTLLNLFSANRTEMGLAEIVRLSGRDKATVHRHLVELQENGFLEQHPVTRAYRLGPALLRLSAVREAAFPIRALLRPIVTELAEATGELAHASLLQGNILSPLIFHDPRAHGVQVHFDQSEMLPLHATSSGLAVLAFSTGDYLKDYLSGRLDAHTAHTPTDPERLTRLIDETRQTGLGRLDGAFDAEVSSEGAAVFGPDGMPVGAISVAVPTVRAKPDKMAEIGDALLEAAQTATHSLGGKWAAPLRPSRLGSSASA